jgi:hypothetical protein
MEMNGHVYTPAALPPEKNPGTYWIGGWVGPRASVEHLEKNNIFSSTHDLPGHNLAAVVTLLSRPLEYYLMLIY